MKKLAMLGLTFACVVSGAFGLLNLQSASTAVAEENETVQFSTTKYMKSNDMDYLLIATAIQNFDDVYEVGYDFGGTYEVKDTDRIYEKTWFSAITVSGRERETAADIFGVDYEGWGMIIWEISYDPTQEISYTPYALVGQRDAQGNLQKPTDPANVNRVNGTLRTTPNTNKVTFMDGSEEIATRTVTYGQALTDIPALGTHSEANKEFYWALEGGAEADFSSIKSKMTVYKAERTIVNSVAFDFDLDVTYDDGYEFLTADGEGPLSKNVDFAYGENIAFAVYVKNEFNRSIDDVKYVFHNADGTTKEFTAGEAENNLVVYTLDTADAGDGYVKMVGEYKENTYEFVLNLDLYDWGVLESLDGVTVTLGGKSVEVVDGKVEATLAAGTYSVVVTEPTTKTTEIEVVVEHPTTWNECLTFVAEETVAVGYSRFWADDATSAAEKTKYFTQDANGLISSTSTAYDNNASINLSDYTIDANKNFAVKVRFIYNGGDGTDAHFCIRLDNSTNYRFIFEVTKSYFRVAFGTPTSGLKSYLAQHDLGEAFKAGVTVNGTDYRNTTDPFVFDWMIVKTEGKLSIYHTIGASNGFIHFADVTTSGIILSNGEFAHANGTTNDIVFDSTVANVFTTCLAVSDLKMQFYNLNAGTPKSDVDYIDYGVTYKIDSLITTNKEN